MPCPVSLGKCIETREPGGQKHSKWIVGSRSNLTPVSFLESFQTQEEKRSWRSLSWNNPWPRWFKTRRGSYDIPKRTGFGELGQRWRALESFTWRPKDKEPAFQASAFHGEGVSNSEDKVQIPFYTAWSSVFYLLPFFPNTSLTTSLISIMVQSLQITAIKVPSHLHVYFPSFLSTLFQLINFCSSFKTHSLIFSCWE